jgi:hypothetical protein
MSDETGEIPIIRKYLLGDLPESESERIERWYFADGQAVDEVWAAFGEIAEERLSGALSESESRRFEEKLRSSPALREMFENEKALYDYAARINTGASRQVKSDDSITGGWGPWRRLITFLKSPRLLVAGVVAMIAFSAFGAWFALREGKSATPKDLQQDKAQDQKAPDNVAQTSVDPQPPPQSGQDANDRLAGGKKLPNAQPEQRKSAPGTGDVTIATFLLLVAGTREGENKESYPILEIPARTETVQLELEPPTDNCAVFSAVLETESGDELKRWNSLRTQRSPSTLIVASLRFPAGSLKDADYAIRLECVSHLNNPTSAARYRFRVKKNIS